MTPCLLIYRPYMFGPDFRPKTFTWGVLHSSETKHTMLIFVTIHIILCSNSRSILQLWENLSFVTLAISNQDKLYNIIFSTKYYLQCFWKTISLGLHVNKNMGALNFIYSTSCERVRVIFHNTLLAFAMSLSTWFHMSDCHNFWNTDHADIYFTLPISAWAMIT